MNGFQAGPTSRYVIITLWFFKKVDFREDEMSLCSLSAAGSSWKICHLTPSCPQRKWSLFCGWCFKSTWRGKWQLPLGRLMILGNLDTCGFNDHHSPWRVFMLGKDCLAQLSGNTFFIGIWNHLKASRFRCFMNISHKSRKKTATFYAL